MIHRLIYVSKSLIAAESEAMNAIARIALARNARSAVTGFLYYDSKVFIQEIEGMAEDVDALYASIRRDTRHTDVRTILRDVSNSRAFGGWTMGLHDGSGHADLLAENFGTHVAEKLSEADGPNALRFLRELSLGRPGLLKIAETGPMAASGG